MGTSGFIPFAVPSVTEADCAAVVDVVRSGWWTTGARVREFERAFAEYRGVAHAVAVNSCTAALHLALVACGVAEGDLVVTTTYTFAATAEVCEVLGATPVLLDVDPVTLNIDTAQLRTLLEALGAEGVERAVRRAIAEGALPPGVLRALPPNSDASRVKAVIPVHFAGQACEMEEILACARPLGIHVVEDAAHATEASYHGQRVGSIGDVTAFSFYATKNLSTGEGGMATTQDPVLADRMRSLSLHGISRNAWNRYSAQGSWRYEILEPGYKYNLTDLAAALGIGQLARIGEMRNRRLQIVARYRNGLRDVEGLALPRHVQMGDHAWHLYVMRVLAGAEARDGFIERLREAGIGTSVHFIPLHLHPYYRERYGYRDGDYPVAERAFSEVVSLPLYPSLTDSQVDRIVSVVRSAISAAVVT